jgi:D-alanyl-D-alanine carboxypeptidase
MRRGTAILAFLLIVIFSAQATASGPALLFEATSGKVLYAEDADDEWHPASLTKMMTAYLTFQAIKDGRLTLKSKITCSKAAHKEPPSKIGLPVGGKMTVNTALKSLIIKSANDVAVMLAEAVGGSERAFVARMNATAKKLGMTRTKFFNPNGLPDDRQVTTARDMAKLARAVIADFPEFSHYWSMPAFKLGKSYMRSHNGLLRSLEGADGLKTGFTCDSGFNIVASATRDGRQLIAVVLGDPTSAERNVRAAGLLEYGFQKYGWMQIFNYKTIDNMPLATDAAKVVSVREDVESWGCNPNKKKKAKAKLSGADTRTADNKDGGGLEEFLDGVHANVAPNLAAPELRGSVGLGDQAD